MSERDKQVEIAIACLPVIEVSGSPGAGEATLLSRVLNRRYGLKVAAD